MEHDTRFGWFLKSCVFVLVTALAPAAWSQSSGACYVADVPGPIVLPDNRVEQAGRLEICLSRMYSPVAGFHRTSVNGRVAGLFISRKVTVAAPRSDERAYFVFVRFPDGKYELESYTLTDGQTQVTFEMRPPTVRSRWHVRQAKGEPLRDPEPKRTRVILLASMGAGR